MTGPIPKVSGPAQPFRMPTSRLGERLGPPPTPTRPAPPQGGQAPSEPDPAATANPKE